MCALCSAVEAPQCASSMAVLPYVLYAVHGQNELSSSFRISMSFDLWEAQGLEWQACPLHLCWCFGYWAMMFPQYCIFRDAAANVGDTLIQHPT